MDRFTSEILIRKKKKKVLKGKKILLGVCGSIAAYKSAYLVRLLVKEGADVRVVMTNDAKSFVAPLTFATLSKNPIIVEFYDKETGEWENHVEISSWADLFIIAPCTANTLSKFANGLCDNILSAVYLSATCPVFIVPAMDLDMYRHPATVKNIETIKEYGNVIIPVDSGELASGLEGQGRMAEPEMILEHVRNNSPSKVVK